MRGNRRRVRGRRKRAALYRDRDRSRGMHAAGAIRDVGVESHEWDDVVPFPRPVASMV